MFKLLNNCISIACSKILLRTVLERIRAKTEMQIIEEYAGLQGERYWRSDTQPQKSPSEKHQHRQPVYMCFIHFRKAFHPVPQDKLLLDMGHPPHPPLVQLLVKQYQKQRAKIKVVGVTSDWFEVQKGVRQGYILSPNLFNILAEMAMRKALDYFEGRIATGGRMLSNL